MIDEKEKEEFRRNKLPEYEEFVKELNAEQEKFEEEIRKSENAIEKRIALNNQKLSINLDRINRYRKMIKKWEKDNLVLIHKIKKDENLLFAYCEK